MNPISKFTGIASAVLIGTIVWSLTATADIGSEPKNSARHDRIVGLWDVQVSITNCSGGPIVASFPAMHKYEAGGTGQVVPGSNPARLSAHMMVWTYLSDNNYLSRFKMYRFDATGQRIGWAVLTNEVSIDEAANEYTGTGISEIYDNDGNFLMASCPSFVGTRFGAEP